MAVKTYVRWMIRRDLEEVLAIETASFEFAWTQEDFLTCLRQRNCIGMVAERREAVIGFMVYELIKDALHVLNFGVDPGCRREGIGGAMVEKLKAKLGQQRRSHLIVEVRERNLEAQCFFRASGFVATEVLRGHYVDTDEDAYRMVYRREWGESESHCEEPVEIAS